VLNREIPFLRICLPLCAGIVSGLYFHPGSLFLLISAIIILAGFCASLFFNKFLTNRIYGIFLTVALFTCGLLLYNNQKNNISKLEPVEALYSGILSDYPEEKENSFRLTVKLNQKILKETAQDVRGSVLIYGKKEPIMYSLLPGDKLTIRFTPYEITNRGNPNEFDYRFYMENQGIRYYAFTDSRNIITHVIPERRKLIYRALIIREKIIGMYRERGITGDRLALVAAITLGQKNMLDPEQKQHFIKAGVMHIMAVSGLHAVILSLFVFNLLFFLKRRINILRVIITILILWAFAFVTGLTPSVLRATLMFSFLQAGNLMKRPVNGINSVLASAFVLILIKPSVIFEAGFLLSYSAVIFIICFYRDLYLKIQLKHRLPDLIWQSAAVTLIAQAGTLPLTIMLFNRFPTWFLISNIIIVPLSSIVVITGCLVPLTFPIHFLSQFLADLLNYLTGLTEWLTEKASSLPLSSIENIGMIPVECILLFVTIFLFSFFLLKRESFSIHYPLAVILLLIFVGTVKDITTARTGEVIVYNSIGSATIGIRTGGVLNLYSGTEVVMPEVLKHCATMRLKLNFAQTDNKSRLIQTVDNNILISGNLNQNIIQNHNPDIIILTGLYPRIEKGIDFIKPIKALVITSEASTAYNLPDNFGIEKVDSVHFVRRSGAFRIRL
jgi:competence protein ComEC